MTHPDQKSMRLMYAGRNTYTLAGAAGPATLTLSSWRSRGQAVVAGVPHEMTVSGLFNRWAGAWRAGQDQPVVVIRRRDCVLPTGSGQWTVKSRMRG